MTCVDPTGAGDSFAETFIAALSKKLDEKKTLLYASIAGAMAVSKQGPMEGAISMYDMEKYLLQKKSNP